MGIGKIGWTAAISISLAGCAGVGTPSPVQQPAVQSEARWVETRPDVRTLIVRPDRVGEVARPGEKSAGLAIGSFFARYRSPAGPVDQLALMVVLEGEYATHVLQSGMSLLLEIDGEFFQGEPGLGSNNVHWDPADGGRATLAIPISPELLHSLATADLVRGRIGAYGGFDFPESKRERLGDVLAGIPDDFNPSPNPTSARALIASM
ncbi:MAG TPA: hypothetical protein VJ925_06000 [Longimicrobiales bacterium]|nr:hypothetical protein [Longimicrobiales bacterium]